MFYDTRDQNYEDLHIDLAYTYRSADDNLLYVPYVSCALFKQSFQYRAPALWNSLPSHLRKALSVNDVKKLYIRIF